MDHCEPLDMNTMLEVTKIVDCLERTVARLKGLGSNLSGIESPSMEALEHLPLGTEFIEPGSSRLGPPRAVPIGMDLEEARDECGYCAARLGEILKNWWDRDPEKDGCEA